MLPQLTGWALHTVMQQLRQLIRYNLVELCRKLPPKAFAEDTPQTSVVAVQRGSRLSPHTSNHLWSVPEPDATVVVPQIRGKQHRHYQGPTPLPASPSLRHTSSTPRQTQPPPTPAVRQRRPLEHTLEPYPENTTPLPTVRFVEIVSDTQEDLPASTPPFQAPDQPISLQPGMVGWNLQEKTKPANRPEHINFAPTLEEIPTLRHLGKEEPPSPFVVEETPSALVYSLQDTTSSTRSEPTSVPSMPEQKEVVLTGEATLIPQKERRGLHVRVEKSPKRKS